MTTAADRIEQLDDLDAVWTEAVEAFRSFGIPYLIYLTVDADGRRPYLRTTIPEIYADVAPEDDPFLAHCCDSFAITHTGTEFLFEHPYLSQEARDFILTASRAGFRSGLGVPTRLAGSSRYGGFNLGTSLDADAFLKTVLPIEQILRNFCLIVHRRIEDLTDGTGGSERMLIDLTPREREIIQLVSEGYSRKECARLCGISPHTAAEYIQSAYRKLGVHSRVEAARLMAGKSANGRS